MRQPLQSTHPLPRVVLTSCLAGIGLAGCFASQGGSVSESPPPQIANPKTVSVAPQNSVPVVHVFVALCDNVNQGIVPVSASLGNGDSPATNLYWGAAFGIDTFFRKSKNWLLVATPDSAQPAIMQRLVFKHRTTGVLLVADAYRGKEIRQATVDFLEAAAGRPFEELSIQSNGESLKFYPGGSAALV
ncbi:MAG TPA: hypothetical protein VJM12_19310, partial [Pyrinomonadaceae bacterium]|nr:hypothetical protein [Pyrinomonadaceae bacterium]